MLKAPFFQFLPRTASSFPSPQGGGGGLPSLPVLWELGLCPAFPEQSLLLLPWSGGRALAPFDPPQRMVTHQHFIFFWLRGAFLG